MLKNLNFYLFSKKLKKIMVSKQHGIVINVLSGKGGVGKTTISINLANVIANYYNKETLLIDANLTTSHIATILRMKSKYTLRDLLNEGKINKKQIDGFGNLRIIPAPFHFKSSDYKNITKLKKIVDKIRRNYEVIVIDAAPGIGREVISAIEASDINLCIITPLLPSVVDALRVKELVSFYKDKELKLVVNMREGKKYELSRKEIEQLTGLPVVGELPYDDKVNTIFATGEIFSAFNENSKFFRKIKEVAAEILSDYFYVQVPRKSSWFTRLLFWRKQ